MDGEGRELARVEVERVESRDDGLHVTGHVVPPRLIDGDVLEGEIVEASDYDPDFVIRIGDILAEGLRGFGLFAGHVTVTNVQRSNDTVGVGFTVDPRARGHRAAYVTIDEMREWLGDTSYEEARRQWYAQYRYGELGLTAKDLRVPYSGA